MRGAECLVQVQLYAIKTKVAELHLSQQGVQVGTITDEQELLAHLELVRKRGYSLDLGEHEQEVRCVAAPIFDQYGETIAAISVSGPRDRIDPIAQNKELIEGTLIAANNISKNLGYRNEII